MEAHFRQVQPCQLPLKCTGEAIGTPHAPVLMAKQVLTSLWAFVFQHLQHDTDFRKQLKDSSAILRLGGIALLYRQVLHHCVADRDCIGLKVNRFPA